MDIDNITIKQARDLAQMFAGNVGATITAQPEHPYVIGGFYLIRTVTMTLTGKLTYVGDKEMVLVDAAWIADTGRFANAVKSADFNEVEPYPDGQAVIVGRASIIDATAIPSLPRKQK